jgi:predicted DNA-binding WGR domain protein
MIYLTKIDPAENEARFYVLDVQPTLFGEWALVKEWGRIGSEGEQRMTWFDEEREAYGALSREIKKRSQRGYVGSLASLNV